MVSNKSGVVENMIFSAFGRYIFGANYCNMQSVIGLRPTLK